MSKFKLNKLLLPLSVALILGVSGCSSDSDSTPVASTEIIYTGTNSLSGSFETFASTSLSPALAPSLAPADVTELVKLYVLDESGDLKDTGITCPIEGSSYTCSSIASNKEYIVRYIKDLGNGKVLELKSNVAVANTPVEGVEVSRVTSLIVEAIAKAVEEAVVGIDIAESKVAELIASIKEAIKSSISTLVQQGLISIPTEADMTIDLADGESFDDFAGEAKENENLSDSSGVIVTDESVTNTLNSGKNDAKLDVYATMTKAELVREIFAQTSDGDDDKEMPAWIIDFLGAKYNNVSGLYTVGSFLAKLEFSSRALEDGQWNPEDHLVKELTAVGIAVEDQQTFVESVVSDINSSVNSGDALANLKATIAEHYTLKVKTDKTDADYKKLGDFPPIIEFIFSETAAAAMTANTAITNVGQAIILIIYIEEVLSREIIATNVPAGAFEDQVRNIRIVESDPFFIFEDLGFVNELATYDKLSIEHFETRTDKTWNGTTETEFLSVYAYVGKASWMINRDAVIDPTDYTATLTYPIVGGSTASVDLVPSLEHGGLFLSYTAYSDCDGSTECIPDTTKMDITDNISGDYVITITDGTETLTKTYNRFILKGANNVRAQLISPTEMPQWPEELNGDSINWEALTPEQQTLMNDFNTAMAAYETTSFSINNFTDNTVEGVVFRWDDTELNKEIATLNLPENIVPAYQVSINLRDTDCEQTADKWEECNTEIYNTWWNNRAIQSTSFVLPIPLRATELNEEYNIGVNVVFLDKDTGRELARGGHSWAEFTVGDAALLNGSEQVVINGTISTEVGSTIPTNLKVALMSESCTFDETTFAHTCDRVAIGTPISVSTGYSLSVDVSLIQEAMGLNKHVMVMAFDDKNNDGMFDDWDSTVGADNTDAEMGFWSNNTNVNFENWGDFRVGTSTYNETTGEHTYSSEQVVPGANVTVDNIDFKVFSY